MNEFTGRNIANTLWAMAKMNHHPGEEFFKAITEQAKIRVRAGKDFNAQNLANTLWAYAILGAESIPQADHLLYNTLQYVLGLGLVAVETYGRLQYLHSMVVRYSYLAGFGFSPPPPPLPHFPPLSLLTERTSVSVSLSPSFSSSLSLHSPLPGMNKT
jgi:hypothetical protein